jgi:hypothetical protein
MVALRATAGRGTAAGPGGHAGLRAGRVAVTGLAEAGAGLAPAGLAEARAGSGATRTRPAEARAGLTRAGLT